MKRPSRLEALTLTLHHLQPQDPSERQEQSLSLILPFKRKGVQMFSTPNNETSALPLALTNS